MVEKYSETKKKAGTFQKEHLDHVIKETTVFKDEEQWLYT